MILQVFGTSGSGKSTLFRRLYQSDPDSRETADTEGKPLCVLPTLKTFLLGKYASGRAMGVDGVRGHLPTPDTIFEMVTGLKTVYPEWSVLFEGLVATSSAMTLWRRWPSTYGATYWALLPDLDTCFARVEERGGKSRSKMVGNGKALLSKHRTAELLIPRLRAEGASVRVFGTVPIDTLVAFLRRQLIMDRYHAVS